MRHESIISPVNIVMIEDDEGHARLIEKNIRRAGIHNDDPAFRRRYLRARLSCSTTDGPALNGPALILLDLNLPDMSGTDILGQDQGRRPRCGARRWWC